MRKCLLTIAACLIAVVSGYSKGGYPKLINYNGDSVIAITVAQMDTLYSMGYIQLNASRDSVIMLNGIVTAMRVSISQRDTAIVILETQRDSCMRNVVYSRGLINQLDTALKKQERKIRWLKIERGALVIVFIGMLAYIAFR
ncbi:MAG: hypothetical protein H6550_16090 [Chitinophagales bacterium]|nr:hypothetical protein [Chitinophagales bacterium]